jgi:hypothetical protein
MKMLKASSSEGLASVKLPGSAAGTFFGHRFLEFRHVILDAPQTVEPLANRGKLCPIV